MRKLIIISLILLVSCGDRIDDWSRNYKVDRISPFGTKLVVDHLKEPFPNTSLNKLHYKLYESWMNSLDSIEVSNEVFVQNPTEEYFEITEISASENFIIHGNVYLDYQDYFALMAKVSEGSHVVLSTNGLMDEFESDFGVVSTRISGVPLELKRTNENISLEGIKRFNVFSEVGGFTALIKNEDGVLLAEKEIGSGKIILCSTPELLTNYSLLNDGQEFIEVVLSCLDDKKLNWYANYDSSDFHSSVEQPAPSYLDYILDNPALSIAFGLLFGGGLVFALFGIKRNQRLIPVLPKRINNSVKQNHQIAMLYESNANYGDAALKLINYFVDYLKERYYIKNEDEFMEKFDLSETRQRNLKYLLDIKNQLEEGKTVKEFELIKIEKLIHQLKQEI